MDSSEKTTLIVKLFETISSLEAVSDEKVDKKPKPYISEPSEYVEKLRKRAAAINEIAVFNIGEIVVWKDGLKNKRYPDYGQPAIVLSKIDPPVTDNDDATFSEKLNIQLGFIGESDEFFSFNYDGNRFRKFNQ